MAEQKATAAAGENPVAAVAEQSRALAEILAAWRAAPELQSAGLLLPWWMNGTLASEAVERACGERVAFLCREHQRIMQQMPGNRWRGKPPVLRRIKHFMLAYRDPDLAFLGAADLWRRFQAVQRAGRAEQRAHAAEASQVLSPLLDFLGMRELKETVDNWLLSRGDAGRRIGSTEQEPASHRMFQEVRSYLAPRLPRAQIIHRENAQSHNSHHGALHNTDPLDGSAASQKAQHILDVLILVPNTEACYQALHQLHTLFTPIDDSFRDFIGQNRLNGYRALHTGVVAALQGKASNGDTNGAPSKVNMRVNFAICTPQMDEVNRWGLAALHLRDRLDVPLANTWWHEAESAYRQIESAPLGSLPETLYVFSPQGQLFRFHRGCTVVDFAYHVHSELAAHCRRFYVNGETVEPATVLHHLDLVELEYDPHGPGPTRVWLNAARTSRARSRIDRYLKRQGQGFYHGQKTVDIRLKALEDHYGFNIPEHRVKQALSQEMRRRNLSSMEDLMAEVAAGRLVADKMLHPLFADEIIRQVQIPSEMRLRPHQLHLAQCCRPRLGDDIVGRPYVRDGVVTRLKLHRADCGRVQDLEGNLPLKWRLQPALKTVAQLELRALDDDGLLGDALTQIYSMLPRVTLHRSEAVARNGMANVRFVIEAESKEVLDEIADALRRLPDRNVDEVRHMRLPLSEQEELVRPVSANGINPYTRLPVQKQGMFFGRSKELQDLYDWLRADVGVVWLLGQKRVGKTSLLLHLKNEFLDRREFLPVFVDFQLLGDLGPASVFFEIANAVYGELQGHGHVDELGAPLRNMFEHDPPGHLISYLRGVQSHPDVGRVVLLLDEFSRTTDAYQQERLDESFFQQCRGLIGTLGTDVNFVIVVQQQAFDGILQRVQGGVSDPSWHLMELGERLALKPLEDKDARHLIEWPMRNYLDFSDAALTCVYELTGGSPFLIQAFCFKLVSHMVQQNKRRVEMDDIERVSMEFMSPNESVFAHLLDLIRGVANTLCTQMAQMAEDTQTRVVRWEQLVECFPQIPPDRLRRTLRELCERDVLVAVEPDGWQFACLLFQRWLAFNSGVV
jgi:(p)ppGpp synthase/HD superfamily hydrolase